tara:strand:- start:46 stop:543 length:498 start_codon:yes stop_codon:yes gene_type:complete
MPRSRSIKTQNQIENPEKNKHTGVKDPSILREIDIMPSTLETIDFAVFDYINKRLDLSTMTNKGFKKVPIVWVATERAFQIKENRDLRDSEETLILPLITLERKSVSKDLAKRVIPYANIPTVNDEKGGTLTIARRINQKKTAEFQNNIARRKHNGGRVSGQGFG